MATGWTRDGAVQEQIDATVTDAVRRAQSRQPQGPGLLECEQCRTAIPDARSAALPGVRLCIACQNIADQEDIVSAATIAAAARTVSFAELAKLYACKHQVPTSSSSKSIAAA
jgi:phage/conjugal plasmid C-4 type zinc finger TraR family protein